MPELRSAGVPFLNREGQFRCHAKILGSNFDLRKSVGVSPRVCHPLMGTSPAESLAQNAANAEGINRWLEHIGSPSIAR